MGLCLALGCKESGGSRPDAGPPEVEVAFAGCHEVFDGPACELVADATLTFWLETDPEIRIHVDVDGRTVQVRLRQLPGGRQLQVEVPVDAARVSLRAASGEQADLHEVFRLPVRRWARPPVLEEADRHHAKTATLARALLDGFDPAGSARLMSEVETLRAKIAYDEGKHAAGIDHRERAATLAAQAGLRQKPYEDLTAAAFMAISGLADATRARASLEQMAGLPANDYGAVLLSYIQGRWARFTGDPRRAVRRYQTTVRAAARLGRDRLGHSATFERARLLVMMGLYEAASREFADVPAEARADVRALWLQNRAWVGLLATEVGLSPTLESEADLDRALEYARAELPREIPNVLTSKALSAVQRGDPKAAQRAIDEAWSYRDNMAEDVPVWLLDLGARAARLEGRLGDALEAYRKLDAHAARRGLAAGRWRAAAGQAAVLVAAGKLKAARTAYEAAESTLDRQRTSSLFPSARAELTAAHARAAREHASLLLQLGEPRAAVEVLQRQAARRLRGLARAARVARLPEDRRRAWDEAALRYAKLREALDDLERSRWSRAKSEEVLAARRRRDLQDELRAALDQTLAALGPEPTGPGSPRPRPGEVILGYDRLTDGWLGFAISRTGLRTQRVDPGAPDAPPEVLSRRLLEPFAPELEAHARVRVVARGRLARVDFHALPFGEGLLLDRHVVTYGVDAPRAPGQRGQRGALVVADPDGSLPLARDEGRQVAARLEARGVPATLLSGREVSRAALRAGLRVDLLHWAGHARPVERDFDGLGISVLPLADGTALDVSDVLALPSVPRQIALAGCATARPEAADLGMARAFLLAGADVVIATNRDVRDADALALAEALFSGEGPVDLAAALRRSQLEIRGQDRDWSAFRAVVP